MSILGILAPVGLLIGGLYSIPSVSEQGAKAPPIEASCHGTQAPGTDRTPN